MMHSYQTRRLIATRDKRHDGQNVTAGGEFFATETDARYLIRSGDARDPDAAPPPAPPAADTVSTKRRGVGRPSKADLAARMQATSIETPADAGAGPDQIGTDEGGDGSGTEQADGDPAA